MLAPNETQSALGQPLAVVGAGDLVSRVYRLHDGGDDTSYRFRVFRLSSGLQTTHELWPSDLRDVIKLCQVLAFTVTDDGWLPRDDHDAVLRLFDELDRLTEQWSA